MSSGPTRPAAETGGQPIRVTLPAQKAPSPSPPEPGPEPEEDRLTPQTGLVLGLVVALALLVASLPTVVFFVLTCVLAILHREIVQPEKPLEEYGRIIPERVERLFQRLRHPDGRLILLVLLLAGAVYLAHPIVFGLAGAAALITALYLLDWLDRPAGAAMNWFSRHEDAWAASLRVLLRPVACHALAILAAVLLLRHLAGVFLPRFMANRTVYAWGISGAAGVLLLGRMLARGSGWRRSPEGTRSLARDTLLLSTVVLILGLVGAGVLIALRIRIPLLADPLEWNGVGLALLPALALAYWCGSHLRRKREAIDETSTWALSALAALILAGTGFLLTRALQLEDRGLIRPGSAGLFALILVGWLFAARLLVGLARGGPEQKTPEWARVHLATMASLLVAFFMAYFGDVWGLGLSVLPIIGIWKARRKREARG